jgi:hypothetical protein
MENYSAPSALFQRQKKNTNRGLYVHIYINRVRHEKEMGKLKNVITGYKPFEEKKR